MPDARTASASSLRGGGGATLSRAHGLDVRAQARLRLERANERQRELALGQVAQQRLARRARIARVVEHVVDELERDAEVGAVVAEGDRGLGAGAGDRRARAGGPREERGRLVADDAEVDLFARVEDHPAAQLHDLAVDEAPQRGEQIGQHRPGRRRRRALERMGQEQVAGQDADGVAPDAPRRRAAAPLLAVVDHVVVKERREVHELGDDREIARRSRRRAEARRREEHRERTNALAAGLEQVRRGLRGRRHALAHEARELLVDDGDVRPEQRVHLGQAVRRRDRPHARRHRAAARRRRRRRRSS